MGASSIRMSSTPTPRVVFFTTGDLTTLGRDGKPPMSAKGKQTLLAAVQAGMGFVGVHAASDTFHTLPDPEDRSNRYIAHGDQEDPYLRMLGAEFIIHGREPRLQECELDCKRREIFRGWKA